MRSLLRNSRGVALILTILIIGLIVALTIQFNRTMRSHVASAGNIGHGLKALYVAKSGTSYARAVLTEDSPQVDTLFDLWAAPDHLAGISTGSQTLFAGGRFELEIEDLSGKIQINHLVKEDGNYDNDQKELVTRFLNLEEFGLEADEVNDIVAAIKDWIDIDDDVTPFGGAEDDYYRSLERPCSCKNGPLDSAEELLLVKGVTPELFYGTEDQPGIAAYVSVFGDGKININTAELMVLRSLHEDITKAMAEDMAAHRLDETNDLSVQTWYKNVIGIKEDFPNVAVNSKYLRITSVGHMEDIMRRVVAVVERNEGRFRTLSWKIE